jgi:peptide/nickel transport system permease protein
MAFAVEKIIRLIIVLLAVSALTFLMVNLLPGDVAFMIGGMDATPAEIQAVRETFDLQGNLLVRYFHWLGNLMQGNLGKSHLTGEPVLQTIIARLPVTFELIAVSQIIALTLALPAGIYCAYRNRTPVDRLITGLGFAFMSVPGFVMALLLIFFFSLHLQWLPATGYIPVSEDIWKNLQGFFLPGLSIALVEWVPLMRVLRTDMIATLQEDFIRVARAKGMPTWRILFRDALKPSSLTLITIIGLQVGHWIGAAVIIEMIYAIPGIGRLLVDAIFSRDFLVVQGCVLLITAAYVIINVLVDIGYTFLDPRLRLEGRHG